MRESLSAACIKSYDKAEKGTLSPLECLSFANTIQADLPTCADQLLLLRSVRQSEFSHFVKFLLSRSLTKRENSECLTECNNSICSA